ncbi:MAG: phosphoglycolate phosphatase [Pseudomonadota bacterium]
MSGRARFAAIAFDLDGTLIHSAPDLHAAANELMAALGRAPFSLDQVIGFIGNGVPVLVERALQASGGLSEDGLEAEIARFRGFYDAAPAALTRPYDGAPELLRRLAAAGAPIGLCTNKPEAPTRAILAALDLAAPFKVIVGGDTLPVRKPDPAPLRRCFERLGAAPAQALYVGDSETDEATAAALGAPFALFTGGYRKKPVEAFEAAFIFDDFAALEAHVFEKTVD